MAVVTTPTGSSTGRIVRATMSLPSVSTAPMRAEATNGGPAVLEQTDRDLRSNECNEADRSGRRDTDRGEKHGCDHQRAACDDGTREPSAVAVSSPSLIAVSWNAGEQQDGDRHHKRDRDRIHLAPVASIQRAVEPDRRARRRPRYPR